MPAVTEQTVVGPVGRGGADGDHGDPVNEEHDDREDGQTQPAVRDDLVDLIGGGQLTGVFLLVAGLDDLGDVNVALVGDDALGVVVELLLGGLDVLLDVSFDVGRNVQRLEDLIVALEHLDGVPALLLFGHGVHGSLFDVGNGVLDRAGELVHRDGLAALRGFDGGLGSFLDAVALQRGDLHDRAAELTGQLLGVDLVAVLADDVHHVHRQHHGDAELGELSGEVKVALEVRAVDDVQNGIGARADEVISRYDFLQRVGGQRINARKVGDDDTVMTFELAFLLLDRDARPVADELVGAGQSVEQGGFAAVRVARKGDAQIHFHASFLLSKAFLRFALANRCSKKLGGLPERFFTRPRSSRRPPCGSKARSCGR